MGTYHIITIGCQMNKSDSERIAGHLERQRLVYHPDKYRSDLVVVLTCGVRQAAEDRLYGLIPRIKKANPKSKIILTGCLSQRKDVKTRLNEFVDGWMPIAEILHRKRLLTVKNPNYKLQNPNKIKISNSKNTKKRGDSCDYFKNKPKYSSDFSAYVPIGNGCDNFCSYCVVPYARGREVCRPASEIINEVRFLVKRGYKEIVLIAQNVNSYKNNFQFPISKLAYRQAGFQTNLKSKIQNPKLVNFPKLLRLINANPGDFWIRFATSHPKDMSDELIKAVARCERVCKHIHLPAQAGDDEILRKMNRRYTVWQYLDLVNKIKKRINTDKHGKTAWQPPVAITTDIIVGFPGETKKQFNNTKKLFKDAQFDMAYIAQYSPRPETAAEKLTDDVPKSEKKRREEELNKILKKTALANNKKYLGKTVKILVEGVDRQGRFFGKTETGKKARIINIGGVKQNLTGKFISVKIKKVEAFGMEGTLPK